MKSTRVVLSIVAGSGLLLFMALCWNTAPVSASPEAQLTVTPRPKLTPSSRSPETEPASRPARLHGAVLDWGKGNVPAGVKVVLRGDGWEIPVETNDSGEYRFQDIGNEVAFLNAIVSGEEGELRPLTTDLPIKVEVDKELIVNLAFLPKDAVADSLVGLEMDVSSAEVERGGTVSYRITMTNRWDKGINQAVVADYLPDGLIYATASASQGEVVFDQGLVWANLGSLGAGSSATVTVVAKVDPEAEPKAVVLNRAAAYHSENVAVQAEASFTVANGEDSVLPVTGFSSLLPVAGILLVGALWGARRLRRARG